MNYISVWFKEDLSLSNFKLICECVSDISLAIQEEFNNYSGEVVKLIVDGLQKPNMRIKDQASIIEVVADLISSSYDQCQYIIPHFIETLGQIAQIPIEMDDIESMKSICELRQSAFYSYSIIFQSYDIPDLIPYVKYPLQLIFITISDENFQRFPDSLKDAIVACLFDVVRNKQAQQSQEFSAEVLNGNLKKIIRGLHASIKSQEMKRLLNDLIILF